MILSVLWVMWAAALPALAQDRDGDARKTPDHTARAVRQQVVEIHEAVGTIRPRTEIRIEAQVSGKIQYLQVRPGATVAPGDVLVRLDSRELESRLERARQGLNSARSARKQAEEAIASARAAEEKARSTHERMQKLHAQGAVAAEGLELSRRNAMQAVSALRQAEDGLAGSVAQVKQAEKILEEARINLGYTTITAPDSGEIIKRMVDPGDMAIPGRPLLLLQTGKGMWLEAMVREGLIAKAPLGTRLDVEIGALDSTVPGVVEEIVPSADPRTRTFIVRVGLPPVQGLYQGMFARLRIPVRTFDAVLVPASAVRRVGQLESVRLKTPDGWRAVHVRSGDSRGEAGDMVEILSGLEGGETVAVEAPGAPVEPKQ